MAFSTALVVKEEYQTGGWVLMQELAYRGAFDRMVVPAGFVTDFASVPRVFWGLIPPYGKHTRAAVVHDWLYAMGEVPRIQADGIFRRIMRECGVGRAKRWTMYLALRLFGWAAWRKHRSAAV